MPLPVEETYGYLQSVDGERIELDREDYTALRKQWKLIQGGKRDGKPDPLISTGQAAKILGFSRRTVTRIIDAGKIPSVRLAGGHRRVRISDVVRYREDLKQRQHELPAKIAHIAHETGMDNLDFIDEYLSQFD